MKRLTDSKCKLHTPRTFSIFLFSVTFYACGVLHALPWALTTGYPSLRHCTNYALQPLGGIHFSHFTHACIAESFGTSKGESYDSSLFQGISSLLPPAWSPFRTTCFAGSYQVLFGFPPASSTASSASISLLTRAYNGSEPSLA